jgi:hypothetical protein
MMEDREGEDELTTRLEHLDEIARRMEEEITSFAKEYGPLLLRGLPLPAKAVERFSDLAMDSRRLVRTISRLQILAPEG